MSTTITWRSDEDVIVEQDPGEVLDYVFNYAKMLESGETISESTWSANDGLDIGESEYAPTIVNENTGTQVWISGGSLKTQYRLTNHIVTSSSPARQINRSIIVKIRRL